MTQFFIFLFGLVVLVGAHVLAYRRGRQVARRKSIRRMQEQRRKLGVPPLENPEML